jgi:hypothetical protein
VHMLLVKAGEGEFIWRSSKANAAAELYSRVLSLRAPLEGALEREIRKSERDDALEFRPRICLPVVKAFV